MDGSRPVSELGTSRESSIFGSAHTVNRRLIESPAGFGIPPRGLDVEDDLEVEDYGSAGSDLELSESDDYGEYDDDDEAGGDGGVEGEAFRASVGNVDGRVKSRSERRVQKTATASNDDDDDDDDIDSDEERAVVAQIKEEIKNRVRGEMKEELELYVQSSETGAKRHPDEDDPALADLDPKLREAILRMRKYDRILARKEKKEMQVKRERLRLQKRLRQELEDLKNGLNSKQPRKEELVNTEKFLALAPPPRHDEGVEDLTPPVTPVFATQLPDSEFGSKSAPSTGGRDGAPSAARGKDNAGVRTNRSRSDGAATATTTTDASSTGASTSLGSKMGENDSSYGDTKKERKRKKDFIKRNIELAGDAANTIAMTDDEKCRLDQLLRDISNLPDIPEDGDQFLAQAFEVALVAGEGFSADRSQREQLSRIDDRLSVLMPDTEFRAISSAQELDALKHCQYLNSAMRVSTDLERLGEPTLQETKEEREMRLKLEVVERQLQHLSVHADLEVATPTHLSEEALSLLLGEYAQSLCAPTQSPYTDRDDEDDTVSDTSAVVSIYENVPRLDDVTLQRLLREARSGMSYNELENESDDCKVLKMGSVTDRSLESYDASQHSSRISRPTSDTRRTPTTQRPTTGDLDLRRADDLDRSSSEPRVLLPEINATRFMVAAQMTTLSQNDSRPTSRERRSDGLARNSFEQKPAVSAVSPPLSAPPRRPPSRPRNLAPISTHLDLDLSDDEQ